MAEDVTIIIKGKDQATKVFKAVETSATKTEKAFGKFNKTAKKGASISREFVKALIGFEALKGAVRLTRSLTTNIFNIGAANERYRATLTTLLGSQEASIEKFDELNAFARDTPFQIEGLMDAFINLKGLGLDPTIETMRILGDTTSALGGNQEKLLGIGRALGQIQTKGKVSAEELLQLAEQGIPAYEILREKLNLTRKEVANIGTAGITSEAAISALLEGMDERFSGQMEKMASTATGKIEAIKSLWREFITLVTEGSSFDAVKESLDLVRLRVEQAFDTGDAQEWADKINNVLTTVIETGTQIPKFLGEVIKFFGEVKKQVSESEVFEQLKKEALDFKTQFDDAFDPGKIEAWVDAVSDGVGVFLELLRAATAISKFVVKGSQAAGVFAADVTTALGGAGPINRAPEFHNGGLVRRYHNGGRVGGLASDEVPIIAQTGERVLSRTQNREFESGGMGGLTFAQGSIVINAGAGDPQTLAEQFDSEVASLINSGRSRIKEALNNG